MTALFERLLGGAFETLPACVRRLHRAAGTHRYRGEVEVERGHHPLARLCAWATRLPPEGQVPIEVAIAADADGEHWSRHVGGHVMPSHLRERGGLLHERLGLATFVFRLSAREGGLEWSVVQARALGVPLPARWFVGVTARESEVDGHYHFEVRAALPLAGLLVHYRGWLDVG